MAEPITKLRATVEPKRYIGKTIGYTAKLSDTGWEVSGKDKETLIGALHRILWRQCEFIHTRRYVRKGDVTFALYYANGWQYDIVRDDGTSSTCMLNCDSYADALERMLAHANEHGGI